MQLRGFDRVIMMVNLGWTSGTNASTPDSGIMPGSPESILQELLTLDLAGSREVKVPVRILILDISQPACSVPAAVDLSEAPFDPSEDFKLD